jgi:K+-sensing histidine kinase KdpD
VGKTYAMLDEGNRRADNGEHVVVGWVERHGRGETRARLGDLPIVPPRQVMYRGTTFPDLDVEAVISTGADVVLVDEMAHTSADGRRRWEDIEAILGAGMDVMTTINVANLSSVRDYAAQVTGAGTVETVGDELLRGRGLLAPPARRSVVAGVSGTAWEERVIARAAVLAIEADADLYVVHVADGARRDRHADRLDRYREDTQRLGGTYLEVQAADAADGIAEVSRDHGADTIVVARQRSRLAGLLRGAIARKLRRRLPDVTVVEVGTESPDARTPPVDAEQSDAPVDIVIEINER